MVENVVCGSLNPVRLFKWSALTETEQNIQKLWKQTPPPLPAGGAFSHAVPLAVSIEATASILATARKSTTAKILLGAKKETAALTAGLI